MALITLGSDGALAITAEEAIEVRAPVVAVVDTIGAGTRSWARSSRAGARGLGRAGLHRVDELEQAAAFACYVAAITCSRAGADPPRHGRALTVING